MTENTLQGPLPLSQIHQTEHFDCGSAPLNEYLQRYAGQAQRKDTARTYIFVRTERVVAYYTLVYGSVAHDASPPRIAKGLGKYPVPIILLARLAVDRREQGKGLGRALLLDALIRATQAAEIAGLKAILVDAKDEAARAWYEQFGFEPSPVMPLQLFLPIQEILRRLDI